MKKRVCLVLIVAMVLLCFSACGKKTESTTDYSKGESNAKGTINNPYTMDDTITISSYAWEGGKFSEDVKILGKTTFEISNMRFDNGELSGYKHKEENVNVFVFDKKCIDTCYEDGLGWLSTGDIFVNTFYNSNMQSLDFTNITEDYTGQDRSKVVYFGGTTYTEAYALCKIDNGEVIKNDEKYSIVRFSYNDEDLESQYVYIKID